MPLPDEITHAAQTLGELLSADANLQKYLRLADEARRDSGATDLETRYARLFQQLVEQEQNGQPLEQAQLDEYYELRRQVREHPAIQARDAQFESVKALFAETALRMNSILGFDYTAFAR